jgi:hypothetical protein
VDVLIFVSVAQKMQSSSLILDDWTSLSQNYSSRDIRTITNVLTTLDAIFAIKTYVNEVVLV